MQSLQIAAGIRRSFSARPERSPLLRTPSCPAANSDMRSFPDGAAVARPARRFVFLPVAQQHFQSSEAGKATDLQPPTHSPRSQGLSPLVFNLWLAFANPKQDSAVSRGALSAGLGVRLWLLLVTYLLRNF